MENGPVLMDMLCRSCGKDWKGFWPDGKGDEHAECPKCHELAGIEDTIEHRYYSLIFKVGNRYTNESRHMTAMRYLKDAERGDEGPVEVKNPA